MSPFSSHQQHAHRVGCPLLFQQVFPITDVQDALYIYVMMKPSFKGADRAIILICCTGCTYILLMFDMCTVLNKLKHDYLNKKHFDV